MAVWLFGTGVAYIRALFLNWTCHGSKLTAVFVTLRTAFADTISFKKTVRTQIPYLTV